MLIVFVLVGLMLLAVSVRRLRRPSTPSRWPLLFSAALAASMVALSAGGVLVALGAGRTSWNDWTAGTPHRETVTLSLLLVGFPLLLALAALSFVVGSLRHRRVRRGAAEGTSA